MTHLTYPAPVAETHSERTRAAAVAARAAEGGRVAVVLAGAGFIADTHLAALRNLGGTQVVGVCDPNEERCEALRRQWGIPHAARSLGELLRGCKPDVVHVLVPPAGHVEVARQALEAGAHVFVEKPLALRGEDSEKLLALATAAGLRLGVNHNWLFHPLYAQLQQDLAAGRLGQVQHVVSAHNLPLRQLAAGEHDHWMFREPGNILFEQAVHPLSQVCHLLGPVRQVTALCSAEQTLRTGVVFPTRWQLSLVCERGTAQVYLAFGRSFPDSRVQVLGQDGTARLDLLHNVYVLDRQTPYFEVVDRFARDLSRARQVAWCGTREMARYGLSVLRLTGRSDPFYVGMRDSIAAFYRSLPLRTEGNSAVIGHAVVRGLEMAARAAAPGHASTPAVLAAVPRPREGEVLVLGGTGFIGRRLVAALAAAGCPFRLMARRPALVAPVAGDGSPSVCGGDFRNPDDVRRAVRGCRTVIHLVSGAPPSWAEFARLFVDGTRHVAEACLAEHVSQLIFVSSIAAYYLGNPRVTITEESPLDPAPERRAPYARAKIACERLLAELHRSRGLPVTVFRPGVVVGAGGTVEHSGVGYWPTATHCVSWGRGTYRPLPFVLADDVAAALVAALVRPGLEGKSFNLVGDVRLSADEYIDILRAETGRDIRLHRQSLAAWMTVEGLKWAVKAAARKPENAFPSWHDLSSRSLASAFDNRLAKEMLGWRPVADREEFIERGIRAALREAP
jgi:predicted dehydrogenase/nucleoside-diphosphate-sugar epimerase